MNTNRRVVCAAIRAEDDDIIVGVRHYSKDMFDQINSRFDGGKFCNRGGEDQGFVDQFGKYMTRQEAWNVAQSNGQIIREVGGNEENGGTLYSENLY